MTLNEIAKNLGVRISTLQSIARQANYLYISYRVKKYDGSYRTINHPSRRLKAIQREILKQVFSKAPVHVNVYSYKKGISIGDLARYHAGASYLTRFDFTKFFESILQSDIDLLIEKLIDSGSIDLLKSDIQTISKLVTLKGALTIGAPSSPMISNCIMYSFDVFCADYCRSKGVKYSRYADDIYLSSSSPNVLKPLGAFLITNFSKHTLLKLSLNRDKSLFTSKKHGMKVTGLTLTSDGKVSLGREKKRKIRSMLHHFSHGRLDERQAESLRGYLNFALNMEPTFITSMKAKFGKEIKQLSISPPKPKRWPFYSRQSIGIRGSY